MRVNIQQDTEEWHEMRKTHIGASMAPIIMGDSPYRTSLQLYNQIKNIDPPVYETEAMRTGKILEPIARLKFISESLVDVEPAVFVSDTHKWMMASLDGINIENSIAVEIKCPSNPEDHSLTRKGIVPKKYYAQLQHQMFVVELDFIFYYSYFKGEGICVKVVRNNEYLERMIMKEEEFYQGIVHCIPPVISQSASVLMDRQDEEWNILAKQYRDVKMHIDRLTKELEQLKDLLIDSCKGINCCGSGIKVEKLYRRGSIDYDSIPALYSVELDKYRKPSTEYWIIRDHASDSTFSF